jgi:hypothetical protein
MEKFILKGVIQRAPRKSYGHRIYDSDLIKKLIESEDKEDRVENLLRIKKLIKKRS